ncbi:hypothetical protein BH09ACT8_BH09ACT8_66650 [soil metagenome]
MHSAPPVAHRTFRRRDVLVGAAGIVGLAVVAGTASACGSDTPPPVDPLQSQADLADADSAMARAAATGASPALVAALTQVASERAQHSRALVEEIARAAGHAAPTETSGTSTPSTSPTTSAVATPPPAVAEVIGALKQSAASATALASILTGYRAGLVGSIAASCTTSFTVGFDVPRPAP